MLNKSDRRHVNQILSGSTRLTCFHEGEKNGQRSNRFEDESRELCDLLDKIHRHVKAIVGFYKQDSHVFTKGEKRKEAIDSVTKPVGIDFYNGLVATPTLKPSLPSPCKDMCL